MISTEEYETGKNRRRNGYLIKRCLAAFFLLTACCSLQAQEKQAEEMRCPLSHSDSALLFPRKPFRAAVEVAGINVGIWSFNRYILNADYARIGWSSMRRNIRKGFFWDNDPLSTNMFAHPYCGGLYFNAVRSNGMSLQDAALCTVGGSLMWEYLMENELPSINDLISTSIGGVCLGEITFRLSDLLLDDRTSGRERFGREFLATLVSPVRGFNRIISGEARRMRNTSGRMAGNPPVRFYLTLGYRTLTESREIRFDNDMYAELKMLYNNVFSGEYEKPYDAFRLNAQINLFSCQPVISNAGIISRIWGRNIPLKSKRSDMHWGVFQHFNYYDSKALYEGRRLNSYKISEAAAFGTGAQIKTALTAKTVLVMSSYLNAILLGGSITDYYRAHNRDYNIGSGYSSKNEINLTGTSFGLKAGVERYCLYTWKGYDPGLDLSQLTHGEQQDLNVQGDEGKTAFNVLELNLNCRFHNRYTVSVEASYYLRSSHYRFFPKIKNKTVESKIGLGYLF
jgi:hypothetical protein